MNKTTEYPNQTDGVYEIKSAGSGTKTCVLWREVVMAYASPAIMAGIGGIGHCRQGASIRGLDHNRRNIGLLGFDAWPLAAQ
ncbi:hypothetical protein [Paenibacillus sp. RC343]|uniref:hypothetical protein n=1 Tax=Paenibacillus sp. RC343 TaxID=3045841 RepID=UPI0032D948EE